MLEICMESSDEADAAWSGQGWAAALLTLDTGADLGDTDDRTRLAPLGCAMLACLLRMPQVPSRLCSGAHASYFTSTPRHASKKCNQANEDPPS